MTRQTTPLVKIIKNIFQLSLPIAGTQLIAIASIFFCMSLIAKLGPEVLAASALIMPVQMSIMMIGMAILFSMSILIGHAYGNRQLTDIGSYAQQGWLLSLILGIPAIFIFSFIGKLLIVCGQSKPIARLVQDYFNGYLWGVIPSFFAVCNQQICYGINKRRLAIITSLLGLSILVATAYVLIFGKSFFPKLGVAGLGYASAIQSLFYAGFTTVWFYYDDYFKPFHLFHLRLTQTWKHLSKILTLGWPISVHISGELLALFVRTAMVGWLGVIALGAYQVINQYMYLLVVPAFALSQASGILIGQAYGAKKFAEIKQLGNMSFVIVSIFAILVAISFFKFPYQLASLYLNVKDPANINVLHLVITLFMIVAFTQFFDGIRNIFTGSLRGLLDSRFPMYASLLSLWIIGLPLSYLLGFTLHFGVIGISWGSMVGFFLGAIIIFVHWQRFHKKLIQGQT